MSTVKITIKNDAIIAIPTGYDKNIKRTFSNFGGAQHPFEWNGKQWEINGTDRVTYWASKVKAMFDTWKESPAEIIDLRQ